LATGCARVVFGGSTKKLLFFVKILTVVLSVPGADRKEKNNSSGAIQNIKKTNTSDYF
jgi:hypothetical protein